MHIGQPPADLVLAVHRDSFPKMSKHVDNKV